MATELITGHYYRWTGPERRPGMWNGEGKMDFMLDSKPHLCTSGARHCGRFSDSGNPEHEWSWSDGIEHIEDCGTKGGGTYIPTVSRSKRRSAILLKLSIE